jgi:glutathione S-transferase
MDHLLVTKMVARVELIVHPLCPFAHRALYTKAFKNLDIEVLEVELVNKVDWFLAVNPQGKVPSARVTKADGRHINLFESLTIMHYLDSFPGRSLIPEEADGTVSPLTRAACDAQAQYIAGKFMGIYNFYKPEPTAEQVQSFKTAMREVNAIIGSGFTMDSILGTSQITFTDIAILPFIERFVAYKEAALSEVWEGEDFSNIQHFYDRIFAESWTHQYKADPAYLRMIVSLAKLGKHPGLKLPITRYESLEAYEA